MNDITFIIHLRKDTDERAKNVDIVIAYYKNILPSCKFIVVEDDKIQNFEYLKDDERIQYIHFYNEGQHNKCKGYNIGLNSCETDIVCFLDIDCIVSKQNIEKAINTLENTDGLCIGYNGTAIYFNYTVKDKITDATESLYDFLETFVDTVNIRTGYTNEFYHVANTRAVGGMLLGYNHIFKSIGGFNPNFKGWGYEDNEIIIRARKLKVPIYSINTPKPFLFHLPHISEENKNKEDTHASYKLNEQEYLKITRFNLEQTLEYIKSWK
jgi:predicted glycosyltransferase involved in capsule biosynthesis